MSDVSAQIGSVPALGGAIAGGAVVDETEVERVEIERTRAEIVEAARRRQARILRTPRDVLEPGSPSPWG
jgi:hypothetical protein